MFLDEVGRAGYKPGCQVMQLGGQKGLIAHDGQNPDIQYSTSLPVFSIAPHYHHHSPPRPSSKSNWDFGSISPENKPPVFG